VNTLRRVKAVSKKKDTMRKLFSGKQESRIIGGQISVKMKSILDSRNFIDIPPEKLKRINPQSTGKSERKNPLDR
jgi:hypothetical protein